MPSQLRLLPAAALLLAGGAAHAQANPAQTVFLQTNAADGNAVIAFHHDANSPAIEIGTFPTGGRGSGGVVDPLQSQGSVIVTGDHNFLLVTNAGSGTVSVFRITPTTLQLVDHVPSGGSEPVSIAEHNGTVYVLNGAAAGAVTTFALSTNGRLRVVSGAATRYLSGAGAGGSSISVSPDGHLLAVTERNTNSIDIFPVGANGAPGTIVTTVSKNPGLFSAAFAPSGVLLVDETGPAGAVNGSTVSSYSVASNGTLSAITSALPTYGAANCWNALTPNGHYLYVSNAMSSTISGFTVAANGTLAPIGSTVLASNPSGSANIDIAVSLDGTLLYSLNAATGTLGVFSIAADGTLTLLGELSGVPASAGVNGLAAL
jgi:6-phosphogluconolactonase